MGMAATRKWVRGETFASCLEVSPMSEGTLVRLLLATTALLMCFAKGATLMGNKARAEKLEDTSTLMKRGTVFTASLYLD
jgi:superfamily II RNA helicase